MWRLWKALRHQMSILRAQRSSLSLFMYTIIAPSYTPITVFICFLLTKMMRFDCLWLCLILFRSFARNKCDICLFGFNKAVKCCTTHWTRTLARELSALHDYNDLRLCVIIRMTCLFVVSCISFQPAAANSNTDSLERNGKCHVNTWCAMIMTWFKFHVLILVWIFGYHYFPFKFIIDCYTSLCEGALTAITSTSK